MILHLLPHINASPNAIATVLLVAGVILIKQKHISAHKRCMITAFGVSTLFLLLYVTHKFARSSAGSDLHTTFNREGVANQVYLLILFTHVGLAMVVPVVAIRLIRLAVTERFEHHRRLARIGLPIWLYVSITGVVIYLLLYHWNPPPLG